MSAPPHGPTGPPPLATWTGDRLRGAPRRLVAVLGLTEVAAIVLTVLALSHEHPTSSSWLRVVLLFGMAVTFEEMARRVGKMRLLIASGPQADMTSVWTFAAPLAVAPGQAAVLEVLIAIHLWVRLQRGSGRLLYRKIYSGATVVLACLAAGSVLRGPLASGPILPDGAARAGILILALIVYTAINRILIVLASVLAGAPRSLSALVGTVDDNTLEVATLCLGYFTALALVHTPWLAPLILVPTLLLQRGALVKELERTAATDTKTQVLTALAWEQGAQHALALAERTGEPIAVMLIDLDRFKVLNDTYGHLVGDAALACVGAALRRETRHAELVGRFGGEEFVVLLPGVSMRPAKGIAERLRSKIAAVDLTAADLPTGVLRDPSVVRISASIGVACFPEHGSELADLLHAADGALYTAKRSGRNRVEIAGASGPGDEVRAVH